MLAANLILMLSTRRILFGGGVMARNSLFAALRAQTKERLKGYLTVSPFDGDLTDVIMPPGLGKRAGPLGALALAMDKSVISNTIENTDHPSITNFNALDAS
ncbi:ROK family protein [Iodidimonas gelatinilytica]|uniref:ROK family protein n=1 Tax=Iodidimonas gelatinilytica TaxID=1236966 RepID=UPI001B2FF4FD|nr:ROK family protein [Iodidimonas gelatinilytica]